MSHRNSVPKASSRVSDEIAAEIVRLDIRGVPHNAIASQTKVHRQTVERVLERTRASREISHDTTKEFEQALDVYRAIQAEAWAAAAEARNSGKSPAPLLAEVRQAQTRMDDLLGLQSLREGQSLQTPPPTVKVLGPEYLRELAVYVHGAAVLSDDDPDFPNGPEWGHRENG